MLLPMPNIQICYQKMEKMEIESSTIKRYNDREVKEIVFRESGLTGQMAESAI